MTQTLNRAMLGFFTGIVSVKALMSLSSSGATIELAGLALVQGILLLLFWRPEDSE